MNTNKENSCSGGCCGGGGGNGNGGGSGGGETETSRLTWAILAASALLWAFAYTLPPDSAARTALYLVAYGLAGWQPLGAALRNIARGEIFDENFLMAIATVGAVAIGEYPEAVAVLLFYQVGEAFQDAAVRRSRQSIRELVDLRSDTARVVRNGAPMETAPDAVAVGEMIVVNPGERVPLDGEVAEGRSALDLSALTGESLPRDAVPGNEVLAGSVNLTGVLRLRVTRPYEQSTVARILALVQDAAARKARTEALITRFARVYTPAVIALSAAVMVLGTLITGEAFSVWLYRGLIFLVASCPCALLISIPLGFFGGIGGASRQGVLVKGGNYLEALARVRTMVFDKTGTLTTGRFVVDRVTPLAGLPAGEVLELAAHAEMHSSHPLAKSLVTAYGTPRIERVSEVREEAGLGVAARVDGRRVCVGNAALLQREGAAADDLGLKAKNPNLKTDKGLWVAVEGRCAGHIALSDAVRPEAARALDELKALGISRLAMLTGDAEAPARAVAEAVGIQEVHAGLLPEGKVEQMRRERGRLPKGGLLAYVGDGINDAPVLTESDVGIAMGALGSDSAIEAADVVIMTDDLTRLGAAVRQARATRAVVMQNIVFALGFKAVVLVASVAGYASMWGAVFADVGVALLATLNAMRLIRSKPG
jgi:Cd2+/Zn2+-exporting ATPase